MGAAAPPAPPVALPVPLLLFNEELKKFLEREATRVACAGVVLLAQWAGLTLTLHK